MQSRLLQTTVELLEVQIFAVPLVVVGCGVGHTIRHSSIGSGASAALGASICALTIMAVISRWCISASSRFKPRMEQTVAIIAGMVAFVAPYWSIMYVLVNVFGYSQGVDLMVYELVVFAALGLVLGKRAPGRWNEFLPSWGVKAITLVQIHQEDMFASHSSISDPLSTRVRFLFHLAIHVSLLFDAASLLLKDKDGANPPQPYPDKNKV